MSGRFAPLAIVAAALAGLAALTVWAPDYLVHQGFPLDDAWIHAVYGRALARSGMLAYNPHTPATGSTAPLWGAVFALMNLVATGAAVVPLVKVCGFVLHLLTALVLFAALRDDDPTHDPWRLAGAVLVALHPDLVSASVSGMEVSLATLAAVGLLYAAARGRWRVFAVVAGLAVLVRPELAVVSLTLPLVERAARHGRGLRGLPGAGAATALAFGLLAARNLAVSGLPLPATFYAKVGQGPGLAAALRMGFDGLLRQLPIVNSLVLLGGSLGIAATLLRTTASRALVTAAASLVSGLVFCAISFALVAPIDPGAFYHQRYVLPALPLLVGPLPLLLHEALRRVLPARLATVAATAVVACFLALLVRHAPQRYAHLANDARNIDDVQVAIGRQLADADPGETVWAVDAGAVRYFGNAFVVDLMGLNTPALLGAQAQPYLDAHPPRYVEVVPGWSSLRGDPSSHFAARLFEPTTPYTVTGFPEMRRHWLVRCDADQGTAQFGVRTRVFDLACAAAPAAPDLVGIAERAQALLVGAGELQPGR